MGKTFSTGLLTNGLWQDASNNIGIGGSPSGSYKLEVTGTAKVSSTLLVSGATTLSTSLVIGSTDSTWNLASSNKLQIQNSMLVGYSTTGTFLTMNLNYNSGWKYISTGTASLYSQDTGDHVFFTSTSGTAAAAATLNEKMRITNAGNVGIGTTSPASKLEITSTNQGNSVTYGSIYNISQATAINDRLNINFAQNGNQERARAGIGAIAELANGYASSLAFYTRYAVDSSALATTDERLRIKSNGSISIIGSSATNPSNLSLTCISSTGNNDTLRVATSIENSGKVSIESLGTGLVYSNAGLLTNTNPSDNRLKENIKDINWGLFEIIKLRPVSYTWVNDNIQQGLQYGFIAQEVQEIMPDLVKEFTTKDGEDDVIRLGLEKEGIYATLVKAIQELSQQNQDLKSRLDKAGL